MAREKVEFDVIGRDAGGSKAFRQVGDAAAKAGDQVEGLGKKSTKAGDQVEGLGDKARRSGDDADGAGQAYRGLAAEIEHTEGRIRSLAAEIDRTGNKELFKDLRRQQSELRKLNSAKSLLPDMDMGAAGGQAAAQFSAQFVQRLGPLLARAPMGPAGAAIGAAVAVGLVPMVAGAIQGAVVGGVGVGGVIGGVALASKDARVQAAGKQLGENLLGDLEDSASRFVEPTLAGIRSIQRGWDDVSGDIDAALAAASAYVEPLADGVADFMREIAPGIRDAAEAAEPIVQVVREELPVIGEALSDMLSSFSEDANTGASAVRGIFMALENGIDIITGTVNAFSSMYGAVLTVSEASFEVLNAVWGWVPGFEQVTGRSREQLAQLRADFDRTGTAGGEGGEKAAGGLQKVETVASTATVKVESLNDAIKRMAGENISAEQANIRLEEAIDRATEAGRKNNDGIDRSTEKGRANRSLLVSLAEASNTTAEAIFKQTGSQELASEATEKGRAAFLKSAAAMGVSKGEARKLADQLFGIPKKVDSKITVTANTQPALDSARSIVARINNMHARINVSAEPSGGYGGSAHTGDGYSTGMRWGGAFEHAQTGLLRLRDAGIYPAAAPARYAFAEPATGGEAFIPKHGDQQRSVDILTKAAGWYGQMVVPAGGSAGGGGGHGTAPVGGGLDEGRLGRAVARALSGMTLVLDDRTGRTATLMARGA